jgi:thymidylate synthase (FAD)
MKIVDQPKVYLVGKTDIVSEGMEEYLADIGGPDWFVEPRVSGGENLIEAAGRMCYRSWQPWDPNKPECSNPNVTKVREGNNKYMANIIKSGHGAVLEHVNLTFIIRDCWSAIGLEWPTAKKACGMFGSAISDFGCLSW